MQELEQRWVAWRRVVSEPSVQRAVAGGFIEWPFKLLSNVFAAEEAKTDSREASRCQNALFRIAACCARRLSQVTKFHLVPTQ